MAEYEDQISEHAVQSKIKLPAVQKTILFVILLGYPLLTLAMHYLNPPTEVEIQSKILQIYVPGIIFQGIIFLAIMMAIIAAPLYQDGRYWKIHENIASIGIQRSDFKLMKLLGHTAIGVIFLFIAIIFLTLLSNILGNYQIFSVEDITYLLPQTLSEKSFWIVLSISAGIAEELAFRGYVLTRMEILTGSIWPGILLGSACFGIGHLYQGWSGVILIAIYGVMFSLLFYSRGSLIPCMIAHSLQDIMAAFAV